MYDSADHKRLTMLGTLDLCPFVSINLTKSGIQAGMFLKTVDLNTTWCLKIRVGLNPAVMKIQDLLIDHTGFSGVFLIQGVQYHMFFPWDSVFSIEAFDDAALMFRGQWHDSLVQSIIEKAWSSAEKLEPKSQEKPKLKRIK